MLPLGRLVPVILSLIGNATSGGRLQWKLFRCFGTFVQSLSPESEAAQGLQHNWDGGEHLPARLQELCSPPHIMSALCVWIARQCDECFSTSNNVVVQRVPSPVSPPPGPYPVPRPSWSAPANPLKAATPPPVPSDPVNPFSVAAPPPGPLEPAILSVLLLQLFPKCLVRRLLLPTRSWLCLLNVLQRGGGHFPDAGPARLTRFLEMSLDNYYHCQRNGLLGRSEHIGHATVRVEAASAWGVWLRVDHLACVAVSFITWPIAHCRSTGSRTQFNFSCLCSKVGQLPSIRADLVSPVVPLTCA